MPKVFLWSKYKKSKNDRTSIEDDSKAGRPLTFITEKSKEEILPSFLWIVVQHSNKI